MSKYLVYSLLWSMSGDGKLKIRKEMGNFVRGVTTIPLPPATNNAIIDFEVIIMYLYRMSYNNSFTHLVSDYIVNDVD